MSTPRQDHDVVVVRTGTANTASVLAGLRRAGATPRLCETPQHVRDAARVVLPGVGTLAAAMQRLTQDGLVEPLCERLLAGRPTLAICLGLQLMGAASDESPGVRGLGIIAVRATRFPAGVRIPQMGWNRVEPEPECAFVLPGHAYFANSYRLETAPPGWREATTEHGGRCIAALERGAVLACQFHPELSGRWGVELLQRWLLAPVEGSAC